MNSFEKLAEFDDWLTGLADTIGKAKILSRIRSATLGNFGDCAPVGDGVYEMREHYGPGYRVYFKRTGKTVYLLLAGGSKSTQKTDIKKAKALAKRI